MDQLIAFGAGAVLAFGLGYLVGYESHDNADLAETAEAQEATPEDGIVDARAPKLKSLADLNNQASDALATDLSEGEVRELKAMVLPHLTPSDVAGWQTARDRFVERFIAENQELWAVGSNETRGKRFDPAVAAEAEGSYQGQLTFAPLSDGKDVGGSATLDFVLELAGYSGKAPEGRLAFHGPDGSPVWGVQFRWLHLGTDSESHSVSVVWTDFDRRTGGQYSHLALRLPAGIEVGKGQVTDFYGLTPDLTWARAGAVEIIRTK